MQLKTTDILSKFLLFLSWSLVVIAVHFESDRLSDLTRKAPFLIEDLVHPQLSLIDRQHLKFTSRLFRSLDPFDFGVATSQFDGSASQRRRLLKTILALQQQKDIRQHRQLRKNLRVLINKPPFLAPFTGHGEDKIFEFLACSGWDEEFLERDALRVVKPAINGDYATSLLSQIQQAGIAARNNRLLRIASKCANRNLINELFKRKASSSSYSSTKDVIDSAVMSKDVDFVKWLLVRFPKLGEDKDESVVDSAIISGSLDMFKYLLEIINASPKDAAVAQNSRLIKLAAGQGSMEIVEFLLIQAHSTGAASFLTPSVTSEILNKAITSGNVKLVRNLLGDDLVRDKHQPQISTTFRITHGSCSAAIKSGKLALVKYFCNAVKSILKQAGISQNAVFNNKLVESSLFFLTDPAILEFLFSLDKSISPDGRMLNRAFFTGNHRVFKFLVEECGVFVPDALLRQAHEHCKQRRRRSGFGGGERVEGEEDFTKGDRLNRERLYTYLCHEY